MESKSQYLEDINQKYRFLAFNSEFLTLGWKRRLLAAFLGVCATAALPPLYALPMLIPAFAGLFYLLEHALTRRQAFLDGWWWGLGYFVSGLYWMVISLYVEPEKFAWLTPFALFGVQSVLAIYIGGLALAFKAVNRKWRLPLEKKIILFATCWVISEYLRSYLFTGFPWNLIGTVWTVSDATLQLASVIGIYGLSWLTVILATLPALFQESTRFGRALMFGLLLLCIWVSFGLWRLAHYPTEFTNVKVRIVQANIPQSLKMSQQSLIHNVRRHAFLTRKPHLDDIKIVVWSEASLPDENLAPAVAQILPKNTILLTGAVRFSGEEKKWQAWNTLIGIDASGKIIARYEKHHLVPFGEFIPLRHILPLENIAGGLGDFNRGTGPQTLIIDQIPPFSPLICYEAIFPDEATDSTHQAQWLLNVTNDAWFGNSSGPYQHLQMARMRAVEQGLPLIRSANTGISASIDPAGRILETLPLGTTNIVDSFIPRPIGSIYSHLPTNCIIIIIVLTTVLYFYTPVKKIENNG